MLEEPQHNDSFPMTSVSLRYNPAEVGVDGGGLPLPGGDDEERRASPSASCVKPRLQQEEEEETFWRAQRDRARKMRGSSGRGKLSNDPGIREQQILQQAEELRSRDSRTANSAAGGGAEQ